MRCLPIPIIATPECSLCDQADLPNLLNKSEHSPHPQFQALRPLNG